MQKYLGNAIKKKKRKNDFWVIKNLIYCSKMEAVDRKKVVVGTTEERFGNTVRGNLVLIDEPTGTDPPLHFFFGVRDAFVAQATLCCCRPSSRGNTLSPFHLGVATGETGEVRDETRA